MRKVRCALIGAGWWGTSAHLPALQRHPAAEVVAVHSRSRAKAEQVAKDFSVSRACTSLDEVFATPGLEAVVIATTPNVHYEQARAALERGLHVLIEKPMTFTAAEAAELQALAQKKGLQLLISCPWHFTTHARAARQLIQSGQLGQLKLISVLMTNFTLGLYQGKAWNEVFKDNPALQKSCNPYLAPGLNSYSDPAIGGGGQIYCQVSHAAAYVHYLTGLGLAEVFARFDNGGTTVDVYDTLNLKLEGGVLVSLAAHGASMLSERHFEFRLYGTEGMILIELWKGKMEFHSRRCEITRFPDLGAEEIYPQFAPAENFVDAILGRAPNGSPGVSGVFAMQVIEAAVASVRSHGNIVLPAGCPP